MRRDGVTFAVAGEEGHAPTFERADDEVRRWRTPTRRDLPALGVKARALHHLNYLIADPIHAVALYRDGLLVQVPRPEKFAIHKLIVADRRRDGAEGYKADKDREQAAFLIRTLAEDRPADLWDAFEDARARGPKWRARIDASLGRMPAARDILLGCAAG